MNEGIRKVVLASGNQGKLAEFQKMFEPLGIVMQPQSEFGIGSTWPEAEETGLTFIENAIIKARYAAGISGLPVIADDSGLEVDYLNGEPGIYSARYAGPDASAADNNQKLLHRLKGLKSAERTARFHCVLVYLRHEHDPTPVIAHGQWEGYIIEEALGEHGFGYDPLFLVPAEHCTAAELPSELKNQLSHRAQALQLLVARLKERKH
ncbi:RdgB/HAM1 family non-canonical purine NTP pyrophosphatase [Salinisphaera sp. G21_0]|uniref:RdgB/HAM1 family non-canonical purine NTP pyrophosphatase n=1 Tax=Salinisphaera sp. G21_0 TaxID=2821094 RepID=UPI001ADBF32D|nr:RdgB/HAM1 family non-canonical purine NTP pyrophosphatase [Salinisphaera sp. G21_0]MBO9481784.1 RdgB/HAM1 family non-canonical purine NTP pyrophosphatase [Salinisphaera sp. G21_0]